MLLKAISTVLYAAPKLQTDVKEMEVISKQLLVKFGKLFVLDAQQRKLPNVDLRVVQKLDYQAPPDSLVEEYLREIASTWNVPYNTKVLKDRKGDSIENLMGNKDILVDFGDLEECDQSPESDSRPTKKLPHNATCKCDKYRKCMEEKLNKIKELVFPLCNHDSIQEPPTQSIRELHRAAKKPAKSHGTKDRMKTQPTPEKALGWSWKSGCNSRHPQRKEPPRFPELPEINPDYKSEKDSFEDDDDTNSIMPGKFVSSSEAGSGMFVAMPTAPCKYSCSPRAGSSDFDQCARQQPPSYESVVPIQERSVHEKHHQFNLGMYETQRECIRSSDGEGWNKRINVSTHSGSNNYSSQPIPRNSPSNIGHHPQTSGVNFCHPAQTYCNAIDTKPTNLEIPEKSYPFETTDGRRSKPLYDHRSLEELDACLGATGSHNLSTNEESFNRKDSNMYVESSPSHEGICSTPDRWDVNILDSNIIYPAPPPSYMEIVQSHSPRTKERFLENSHQSENLSVRVAIEGVQVDISRKSGELPHNYHLQGGSDLLLHGNPKQSDKVLGFEDLDESEGLVKSIEPQSSQVDNNSVSPIESTEGLESSYFSDIDLPTPPLGSHPLLNDLPEPPNDTKNANDTIPSTVEIDFDSLSIRLQKLKNRK